MVRPYGAGSAEVLTYSMSRKAAPRQKPATPEEEMVTTRFKTVFRPGRQFFRQWRKHRGLTLEEAGEKTGMTAGNISAMERGAQGYTPSGLQALAEIYETSPGWLLEVNPLERESPNLLSIWDKATDSQRKMIVDLARTVVNGR
jgi:transcriptional regulator with XRE-family HTH domain